MIKIIGDSWAFKEIKNKLHIKNLKEFESLPKKLEDDKLNFVNEWKKQCLSELDLAKTSLYKSKQELNNFIIWYNTESFIKKIKSFFIIYNKNRKIWKYAKKVNELEKNINECSVNKFNKEINNILSEQNLIESLKNYYYSALWEEKVIWEFKNMNYSWILINDFNQYFARPIYPKWWLDKIRSIQIDHIFINNKWVFLIETKNRSENSKKTFKFSPIQQIERSWHAFYIYLSRIFKSDNFLRYQKLPKIYKIIVFIWWTKISTNKPYTKVLYINELKRYIESRMFDINNDEVNYLWYILVNK